YEKADKARAGLRMMAIREIYGVQGWQGVSRLANQCGEPHLVGWELVKEPFERGALAQWLCQWYVNLPNTSLFDSLTSGVLHALPYEEFAAFLQTCLQLLENKTETPETAAGFLTNAPQSMALWVLVEKLPQTVRDYFWSTVKPHHIQSDSEHLTFCIEKLLVAGRPRTAMEALGNRATELSGDLLIRMLKGVASGQEADAPLARSWHIARVFEALSKTDCRNFEMVSLEFTYYRVLEHDK